MNREQLIEQLGHETLADASRQSVLKARATTLDVLLDLVTDEALAGPQDPGEGWVPVHAASLLCAMGDTGAIETLLELLAEVPDDADLALTIIEELPKLGALIVEPAFEAIRGAETADDEYMQMLVPELLVESGVKDERIYKQLVKLLDSAPAVGAELLSAYGDARALPLVRSKLEVALGALDEADVASLEDVIATAGAVIELGGELTETQRDVSARAMDIYAAKSVIEEADGNSDTQAEA